MQAVTYLVDSQIGPEARFRAQRCPRDAEFPLHNAEREVPEWPCIGPDARARGFWVTQREDLCGTARHGSCGEWISCETSADSSTAKPDERVEGTDATAPG